MRVVVGIARLSRVSLSAGSERIRHSVAAQSYVENSRRKLQNVVVNSCARSHTLTFRGNIVVLVIQMSSYQYDKMY